MKIKTPEKKKTPLKNTAHKKKTEPVSKRAPRSAAPKTEILAGIHNLKPPKGSHRKKKLLGRGPSSGHGKTSSRGSKGQTSRAGRDFYLGFEGGQMPLIRRIPKRGFTSKSDKEYQIVNINDLDKIKEATITPELLEKERLIKDKGKPVKILGEGEIKTAVTIQAHAFSKKAVEKISNAGGKTEIINA